VILISRWRKFRSWRVYKSRLWPWPSQRQAKDSSWEENEVTYKHSDEIRSKGTRNSKAFFSSENRWQQDHTNYALGIPTWWVSRSYWNDINEGMFTSIFHLYCTMFQNSAHSTSVNWAISYKWNESHISVTHLRYGSLCQQAKLHGIHVESFWTPYVVSM